MVAFARSVVVVVPVNVGRAACGSPARVKPSPHSSVTDAPDGRAGDARVKVSKSVLPGSTEEMFEYGRALRKADEATSQLPMTALHDDAYASPDPVDAIEPGV